MAGPQCSIHHGVRIAGQKGVRAPQGGGLCGCGCGSECSAGVGVSAMRLRECSERCAPQPRCTGSCALGLRWHSYAHTHTHTRRQPLPDPCHQKVCRLEAAGLAHSHPPTHIAPHTHSPPFPHSAPAARRSQAAALPQAPQAPIQPCSTPADAHSCAGARFLAYTMEVG